MDLFLWMSVSFIIIGFAVLAFIKRKLEGKNNPTIQSIIWLVAGTTAFGVTSIILIVWSFNRIW
ncbi:MAG: hypothetical protein ACQEWF_18430 [Bacillota bacterium]